MDASVKLPSAGERIWTVGARVSTVRLNGEDIGPMGPLKRPAATVRVLGPSASGTARLHAPAPSDCTETMEADPMKTSTRTDGSAVPARIGVEVFTLEPGGGEVMTGVAG